MGGRARIAARIGLTAAAAIAATACVPRPEPREEPPRTPRQEAPAPTPTPAPPPPPAPGWETAPLTPGNWYFSREASGPRAAFGAPASEAQFLVRCDRARRQILLTREGVGAGGPLILRTSSGARSLSATAQREPLESLTAALAATDPLLDALVFSRGRFAVEAPGLTRLVIPAWPEPARVIEECRE